MVLRNSTSWPGISASTLFASASRGPWHAREGVKASTKQWRKHIQILVNITWQVKNWMRSHADVDNLKENSTLSCVNYFWFVILLTNVWLWCIMESIERLITHKQVVYFWLDTHKKPANRIISTCSSDKEGHFPLIWTTSKDNNVLYTSVSQHW